MPGSTQCVCGESILLHNESALETSDKSEIKWTVEKCTRVKPTNAFGKIEMFGFSGCVTTPKTKFLRLDAIDTQMSTLQYFMKTHWKLKDPQLIISIMGGTKKMEKCDDKLLSDIKRGLYRMSINLRTWIITTGIYDGVSRLIGQAVRDRPAETRMEKDDFIVIGITSWGTIANSSKLINQKDNEGKDILQHRYVNLHGGMPKGQVIIDPNHTHFLLVDDGSVRKYNREVALRNKFENFLTQQNRLTGECSTIKIHLLIEGGHAALPTLEEASKNGYPIIVVKHSGRCADLLCNILEKTQPSTPKVEIKRIFDEEIKTNISKWKMDSSVQNQCFNTLFTVLTGDRSNFYIFDYDDEENQEMDKFILRVIFRHHSQLKLCDKMNLALTMRRCDLAREEVFTYDSNRHELDFEHFMTLALRDNQPDFVELLLGEGLVIQSYLTSDRLYQLYYEESSKKDMAEKFLLKILESSKGFLTCFTEESLPPKADLMVRVGNLIKTLTKELLPVYYTAKDFPENLHDAQVDGYHSSFLEDPLDFTNETDTIYVYNERSGRKEPVEYPKFPHRNRHNQRIFTEFDLFLWSVLLNRMEIAKIFWTFGKDQISSALLASAITTRLRNMAVDEGEVSLANQYEECAQQFEAWALELLSTAYSCGKKRTHILLCRSLSQCGGNTCLSMAYEFSSMAFLQHTACQTRLNCIWMGAMASSTSLNLIIFNILFAPLFIRSLFPRHSLSLENSTNNSSEEIRSLRSKSIEETLEEEKSGKGDEKDKSAYQVELRKECRGQKYWKALGLFYSAPITKFLVYMASYCIFLFILTYFVLIELEPVESFSQISIWEYLTWIWCVEIIIEEFHQISSKIQSNFLSKFYNWFMGTGSSWNKFDLSAIFLFLLSFILRFSVPEEDFTFVRISYGLMIVLFYIRFLQFYFAHRAIGPKVIMVNKMLNDLMFFLCIYFVFILAYGSFIQAVLYPNKTPSFTVINDIVYFPFWQTFGEMNLEYFQGNTSCTPGERGCGVYTPLIGIGGGIFILAVNILLVNLLIAMFGYTFNLVQDTSERVWAFYRFGLVQEFEERPALPPPFNLINLLFTTLQKLYKKFYKQERPVPQRRPHYPFRFNLELQLDRKIANFEHNCAHMSNTKEMHSGDEVISDRMRAILNQVQQLRNPMITNATNFSNSQGYKNLEEALCKMDCRSDLFSVPTDQAKTQKMDESQDNVKEYPQY